MSNKDEKIAWARVAIESGARSCTAGSLTGLSESAVRALYARTIGSGSPSGMKPSDDKWYMSTVEKMFGTTTFMRLYQETLNKVPQKDIAFIHAYSSYFKLIGSPPQEEWTKDTLTPERADYFRKRNVDAKALRSTKQPHKFHSCKKCQVEYLGAPNEANQICPLCR